MRIFFLGAGFSKAMGLPLTGDLLPEIVKSAKAGQLFVGLRNDHVKRRLLLDLIAELFPQAGTNAGLPSIVDLLSLIDYALAEGFTVLKRGGAERLRRSRALLEASLVYVLSGYSDRKNPRLQELFSAETCVITTNYDFLPDRAIQPSLSQDKLIDYGMPWRDVGEGTIRQRPSNPTFRLFKLHGSLNWLGCPSCEHIYINQAGVIAVMDTDTDDNQFGAGVTCHCGYAPLRRVIVSPSLSRGTYQTQLRSIHHAALEALRAATEIYIVGYSLPIEDLLIRSLFMRSSNNRSSKCTVKVFQVSEEPRSRYDMHFANYEYLTTGFNGFLDLLSPIVSDAENRAN